MTSQVSDFVARFFIRDQASQRLGEMEASAQRFAGRMADIGSQLSRYGTQIKEGLLPGTGTKDLSALSEQQATALRERLNGLGQSMLKLSASGNASSQAMDALNTRLEDTARRMQRLGVSSAGLRQVQREMFGLTAASRQLGVQHSEAGKSTQFMADATQQAKTGVLQMAAASQGVLAGMAALDGNIQHLALSLIFLQFTGALKTSIQFIALTVAIGGAIKMMKKMWAEKKKAEGFAAGWDLVTGNLDAVNQSMERASEIVGRLGLDAGLFSPSVQGVRNTEALAQAMLVLAKGGVDEGQDELLRAFFTHLQIAQRETDGLTGALVDWDSAVKTALERFGRLVLEFKELGGTLPEEVDVGAGDPLDLEEFWRRGARGFRHYMTITEDFSRQDVADKLGISLGEVDKLFSKMNDLWEDYLGKDREKATEAKNELNAIFKEFEDARVTGVGVWTSIMEDEIDSLVDYIAKSFMEGEPNITAAVNRSLTPATEAARGWLQLWVSLTLSAMQTSRRRC